MKLRPVSLRSDGDVVFANSTCFDATLMERLAHKARLLRPGTFFLTTTQRLPSDEFELLEQGPMSETWGDATIFIHRKLPDEDVRVELPEVAPAPPPQQPPPPVAP